jgi:endonuclease-3
MEKINNILEILRKKYPSNTTTLNSLRVGKPDAFKILISCLLSLRTRDEVTDKVTEELFKKISTPEELVKMDLIELEKIIFSTGHYHKKANTLKSVSKELIERFNSKVPNNEKDLLSIKGIGRKTSNIVLGFAFNKQVLAIDTHCHRIPNRIGLIETKNPEKTEEEMMKILPRKYWSEFNSIFVQFGRDICVPISPKCSICPVLKYCEKKNITKER